MSYVVAAYGLVVGVLLLYGLHLGRERRRLRRRLRARSGRPGARAG